MALAETKRSITAVKLAPVVCDSRATIATGLRGVTGTAKFEARASTWPSTLLSKRLPEERKKIPAIKNPSAQADLEWVGPFILILIGAMGPRRFSHDAPDPNLEPVQGLTPRDVPNRFDPPLALSVTTVLDFFI
jgi:hypothetical protein